MRTETIVVSPITVWEIMSRASLGKLPPVWGSCPSLAGLLRAEGYDFQPLDWETAKHAKRMHRDPLDRMLIATALRHDLAILTDDAAFAGYGVATVW